MKLNPRVLSILTLSAVWLVNLSAAFGARLEDVHSRNIEQIKKQHGPTTGKPNPKDIARRHAEMLELDSDSTLALRKSSKDKVGSYYRYQQHFRGVPVYGAVVTVSEDTEGNLRTLFGHLARDLSRDVTSTAASLSPQQALDVAKRTALSGRKPNVHIENEKTEKMIYIDDGGAAHLSYMTSFYSVLPDGSESMEPTFFIDANTGEILKQWDNLKRAEAAGPGGNVKTGQYEYGVQRGYLDVAQSGTTCTMENAKVKTIDLNGEVTGDTPFSFPCPRNTVRAINGAYSPLNDAHFYGSVVHDMFVAYMGAAPWPTKIVLRAHFGTEFANAEYRSAGLINIGDGNSTRYPYAVLDIIGHEIAHGFTASNDSVQGAGEPAAINEAFSDMAGEAAEYFLLGTNNFEHGRAAVKGTGTIRNMCNPPLDGQSIDHALLYDDALKPHHAAGVYNKAFCVLAKKANWNTQKAFQVFARANDRYWTTLIKFTPAACGVEIAATDLGYSKADVTAAFASVGLSCGIAWSPPGLGLYSSPAPIFTNFDKTIENGPEPPNGLLGYQAMATAPKSSGKRYFEIKISKLTNTAVYPASGNNYLTLRDANLPVDGGESPVGWGLLFAVWDGDPTLPWYRAPYGWIHTSGGGPLDSWRIKVDDVIGVAADLTAGKLYYSLNGAWIGSPAAGTGAVFDQSVHGTDNPENQIAGKLVVPHIYSEFQNLQLSIRGSSDEFDFPIPSGFAPWAN